MFKDSGLGSGFVEARCGPKPRSPHLAKPEPQAPKPSPNPRQRLAVVGAGLRQRPQKLLCSSLKRPYEDKVPHR